MQQNDYEAIPRKETKKTIRKEINYLKLFRYAAPFEFILMLIAFIFSLIKSLAMPTIMIVYGEFCALLVDRTYGIGTSTKTNLLPAFGGGKILTNATREENSMEIFNDSVAYGGLMALASLALCICGTVSIDLLNIAALRQLTRIRIHFFRAIITQDIGWHDVTLDQNFAVRNTDDIEKIREGIAENVSHFISYVCGFGTAFATSMYYGWKLTLVVSLYLPIVVIVNVIVTSYQSKLTTKEMQANSIAGQIAEEVIGAIRTVIAFNGEKKEAERYEDSLKPALRFGKRKGIFTGFGEGVMRSLLFVSCSGVFWYGAHLVLDERGKEIRDYNPGILMIVFFATFVAADNISRISPLLEIFAMARSSGTTIFNVIDSKPKIDSLSKNGKVLTAGLKGDVEFQDVFFSYPSRDEVIIHRGMSFKISKGQTVALVGDSGCGKSSCIQLLQRFYDPIFGQILVDGLDIRKYNLQSLRSNIAIVGQEPVLFATTIGENIRFGKPGAKMKEIEDAAKASGVHNFISSLPDSYNTIVGEMTTQLSGGQKQRIAIARALIQNPKILLLDEATSALDYQSERNVQEALDLARKGRTTIVVSHRLSAIRNADKIIFIENGRAVEEGTHEELMKLEGRYSKMVTVGNKEEPGEENIETLIEDDSFKKSFGVHSKNLQEPNEYGQNNFESPVQKSTPLLPISKKAENGENEDEKPNYFKASKRIVMIAKTEWLFLIIGTLSAVICGCSYPVYAVLFGEMYAALAYVDETDAINRTAFLCIICLAVGIVAAIIGFIQTYLFNISTLYITRRIRIQSFKSIMTQEIAWFDEDKNNVGALSARISGDAAGVNGGIGFPLSGIIQALTNLLVSVAIAFYCSWQLTLVCLVAVPFIVGSVILEAKYMAKATIEEKEILERATCIATEAISNIRTIASLRRESSLISDYNKEISRIEAHIKSKLRYRGLVNSCGQSFPFFSYGAALFYGGVLISKDAIPFQDAIKVSEILLYAAMIVGQSLAFIPALTTSLVAGSRLFHLIDRKPKIQSTNLVKSHHKDQGHNVTFSNVHFKYPKRPDTAVLQGLNLEIPEGKTVALVGQSGCGKSTCIQLLQRFYEAEHGSISIGPNDICRDLTLSGLRQKLSIVSQEPVLFDRTIAENIAYGDNSRKVSLNEVIDSAKIANVHNFITSLPLGYETRLGSKSTQLSGGEKQRIAIARALVRNPKILLLDEATSALDLESEKIVQAALEFACSGRTCIVIAHRLSSIQNSDLICVVKDGRIVEKGTHSKLLASEGIYSHLYKTQPKLH